MCENMKCSSSQVSLKQLHQEIGLNPLLTVTATRPLGHSKS